MLGVGFQHLVTPHQPLLSNPHLHNIFHAFRIELAPPANHIFSFNFLQDNNTLETLYLQDNNIGDKGAAALAKALEVLYTCFFVANSAFKMHAWRHGCCMFPHVSRNSAVQQPLKPMTPLRSSMLFASLSCAHYMCFEPS